MPTTLIVTSNVPDRFRGFLSSCMLELAPGVYLSPSMNVAVRERVWSVLGKWFLGIQEGSIVAVWADKQTAGGLSLAFLGVPSREIIDYDGVVLSHIKPLLT